MDKMGHRNSLIITSSLVAIASIFFILSQNIILLIVLLGIFTVGRAGGLNVARAFISENVAEELRATGMAISDTFQYVARVIGPLAIGLFIDFQGIFSPFIACFILAIIAVIIMIFKDKIFHFLKFI